MECIINGVDELEQLNGIIRLDYLVELMPTNFPIDESLLEKDSWTEKVSTGQSLYYPVRSKNMRIDRIEDNKKEKLWITVVDFLEWQLQSMEDRDLRFFFNELCEGSFDSYEDDRDSLFQEMKEAIFNLFDAEVRDHFTTFQESDDIESFREKIKELNQDISQGTPCMLLNVYTGVWFHSEPERELWMKIDEDQTIVGLRCLKIPREIEINFDN
ncbi:MAG: hypothetical protein HN757_13650 [Calditrichaeota bacterium]|jgi:hypothetical protein|nr:hypothetical protein [Calditrichota bacterium]